MWRVWFPSPLWGGVGVGVVPRGIWFGVWGPPAPGPSPRGGGRTQAVERVAAKKMAGAWPGHDGFRV